MKALKRPNDVIQYSGFADFSERDIKKSNVQVTHKGDHSNHFKCYDLGSSGVISFDFVVSSEFPMTVQFNICAMIIDNDCYCPLKIEINGLKLQDNYYPDNAKSCGFYDAEFNIPAYMLTKSGRNTIKITVKHGGIFIKKFSFSQKGEFALRKRWQARLDENKYLSEVNLPGTHDTAAINRGIHTPYACHNNGITAQLNFGIRALDIRISIEDLRDSSKSFKFYTCHGAIGSTIGLNKYQNLNEALKEIKDFLTANPTEFIVIRFQIDSWDISDKSDTNKQNAFWELNDLIGSALPLYGDPNTSERFSKMPRVRAVRGKVFAFQSKMSKTYWNFGALFDIPDNEERSGILRGDEQGCDYDIYFQDKFKADETEKWPKVLAAIEEANKRIWKPTVYINFASAVHSGILGTYVHKFFINYLGKEKTRVSKHKLGWIFWDYENRKFSIGRYYDVERFVSVVDFIISSNFGYDEFLGDISTVPKEWELL